MEWQLKITARNSFVLKYKYKASAQEGDPSYNSNYILGGYGL
jgi:hypothetical protein